MLEIIMKCPECSSNLISVKGACSSCGFPITSRNRYRYYAVILIILIIMIGALVMAKRYGRNDPNSAIPEPNQFVKFYVKYGTFGDINKGEIIHIPNGALIEGVMTDGTIIRVSTIEPTILDSKKTVQYVNVERIQGGSNIPAGCLKRHYLFFQNWERLCVTNDAVVIKD